MTYSSRVGHIALVDYDGVVDVALDEHVERHVLHDSAPHVWACPTLDASAVLGVAHPDVAG
jgi:hypothetical protein